MEIQYKVIHNGNGIKKVQGELPWYSDADFIFISVWLFNIILFFRLPETVCMTGVFACGLTLQDIDMFGQSEPQYLCVRLWVSHTYEVFSFYSSGEDFSALYHGEQLHFSIGRNRYSYFNSQMYNVLFKQLKDLPDFENKIESLIIRLIFNPVEQFVSQNI